MVETGQWTTLKGRFGLDQDKAYCMFSYANQQAMYSPYQAYGNLLAQGITKSKQNMMEFFPINMASRTMAYRLAHNVQEFGDNLKVSNGTVNCQHMVSMAILNDTRVIQICQG